MNIAILAETNGDDLQDSTVVDSRDFLLNIELEGSHTLLLAH